MNKPKITYITHDCAAQHIMHISIQKYLEYADWFVKVNKLGHNTWWISPNAKKHAMQYDQIITGNSGKDGTVNDINGCIISLFFYAMFVSHYTDDTSHVHEGMKTCIYVVKTLKMMATCMRALNKDDKAKVKHVILKCPAPTGAPLDIRNILVNILTSKK